MGQKLEDLLKELQSNGTMNAGASVVGSAVGALTSNSKYKGQQTGNAIGGGIGAVAGSFIGMPELGQQVGSMIGGLIGKGSDTNNMITDYDRTQRRRYQKLDLSANMNPYGSDNTFYAKSGGYPSAVKAREMLHDGTVRGKKLSKKQRGLFGLIASGHTPHMENGGEVDVMKSGGWIGKAVNPAHKGYCTPMTKSTCTPRRKAFARTMKKHHGFHEDGGMIFMEAGGYVDQSQAQQEQKPQKKLVNIEKGEILIDPINLNVVREYDNENRYAAHSSNPMKEAVGNFTLVPDGKVVIPKKYAQRYVKGDRLSRQSIVAEILKNQVDNPEQNDQRDIPLAAEGYMSGPGPRMPGKKSFMIPPGFGAADIQPIVFNDGPQLQSNGQPNYNWMPVDETGMAAPAVNNANPANNSNPGAGINKKLLASKIAGILPTAYGIANAMGVDPYLHYDENTQYDTAKAYIQGMETTPDIEASKNAIRRATAGRNKVLNNFNSPSIRAEVSANNADALNAEGQLIQGASNMAMEMRNRKRQTLAELETQQGGSRLNMRQQLMNELRMDSANRQNMVQQGITEGAQNFQQGVMDDERIKAINTVAEYYKIDPYSAELLVDQGAYMPKILESIGKLQGTLPNGATGTMTPTTAVKKVTRDRAGNIKTTEDITVSKKGKG